jgi:hypothetical protein
MDRAALPLSTPPTAVFRDGLGERRQVIDPTGSDTLELLCLKSELAAVPSFEFALRERVSRFANFRHPAFGRVRSVERLSDRDAALAVVSDYTPGVRLSDMLVTAEERRLGLDINVALCLIRQLVPAVAALHEHTRDGAHGAIGPERLVVTPDARLVIVEYVLGAALEQLRFAQERYWSQLRIPLPKSATLSRFDQRADVAQVGIVALSLILGRALREDEFPSRIGDVVASTWAVSARGGFEPLPPGLRGWLGRALQLDPRNGFASAIEAQAELEKVLGESDQLAATASLESFLTRYHAAGAAAPAVSPASARPAPGPAPAPARRSPSAGALDTPTHASVGTQPAAAPPTPPSAPAPAVKPRPSVPPPSAVQSTPSPSAVQSTPSPLVVRTTLSDEVGLQSLADAVAVRTPARGISTARLSVPARIEPKPVSTDGHSVDLFTQAPETPRRWPKLIAVAGVLLVLAVAAMVGGRQFFGETSSVAATGTLAITTNPAGAQATVDGQLRGTTPLTLTLSPGPHTVVLRAGTADRSIPVTIAAGTQVSQYIELPQAAATLGQLQIRTQPPGAKVTVDGVAVGTSPMTVIDLAPGEHAVTLDSEHGTVKQTVAIESGMTASLVVPLGSSPGAPVSGWISVQAPIELQVYEGDRLLGTSRSDQIMVSAGRHEILIVNEALGYRATRVLQVPAGRVASFAVELPKGTIALNALPWAEVWIDGEKVGETPIGNLALTIGNHDIVFRHPELGEQRHTAVVTLASAARLSVDLRKQ